MHLRIGLAAFLLFGFFDQAVAAGTVVQCIDPQGNTTFSDRCPPGTRKQETSYRTAVSETVSQEETAAAPVVLYTVNGCDACDLVRHFLQARLVPFNEKDVTDDPDLQKELREASASTVVPVALIGDTVVRGYDSFALKDALAAAGYPDAVQNTAAGPSETESATMDDRE